MQGKYTKDEKKHTELMSKHQEPVSNSTFMPKKPKDVMTDDGTTKTVWVDNTDCEEYLIIQANFGTEILGKIGRAWLEIQEMNHLAKGQIV